MSLLRCTAPLACRLSPHTACSAASRVGSRSQEHDHARVAAVYWTSVLAMREHGRRETAGWQGLQFRQEVGCRVNVLRIPPLREMTEYRLQRFTCLADSACSTTNNGETRSGTKLPGFCTLAPGSLE
jgi:hypothetical protein